MTTYNKELAGLWPPGTNETFETIAKEFIHCKNECLRLVREQLAKELKELGCLGVFCSEINLSVDQFLYDDMQYQYRSTEPKYFRFKGTFANCEYIRMLRQLMGWSLASDGIYKIIIVYTRTIIMVVLQPTNMTIDPPPHLASLPMIAVRNILSYQDYFEQFKAQIKDCMKDSLKYTLSLMTYSDPLGNRMFTFRNKDEGNKLGIQMNLPLVYYSNISYDKFHILLMSG